MSAYMYLLQVLVETERAFPNKSQNRCMLFQNFNTLADEGKY